MGQVVLLKQRNESGIEQVFPRTVISAVEGLEGYSDLNKKVKTLELKELRLDLILEQINTNLETASLNSSNNKYRIDNLSKDVSSLNASSEQFNNNINSLNNSVENLNTELNILDTNCQSEFNRIKNSIVHEANSRVENISDLQSQIDSHSENISKIKKEIPDVVKSIDAKIDDVGNLVIDFKTVGNKNTPISINNVKTVHYLSEEYHPEEGEAPFNGVEIGHVVCVKKDAYVYSKGDPIAAIWVNGETEVYTDTNVVLQTPALYTPFVFWDPYLNLKIGIIRWRLEEDGKGIYVVNDAFSEDVPLGNYYFKEYYSKTYKELLLKAGIYIKGYRGFIEIKDITADTILTVLGKSLNDSLTSLDDKIESIQIPHIDVEGDAYISASASEHNVTITTSQKVKDVADAYADGTIAKKEDLPKISNNLKPLIDEKIDNISYEGVKDDTSIDQKYIDITYSKGETTNHIEILRENLVTVIDVPNISNVKGLITYNQSNYIDSLPNKLSEYNNRISYNENLCSSLNSTFTDEINNINTTLETLINKPGYVVANCVEVNLQEVIDGCDIGSIIEIIPNINCYNINCYSWVCPSGNVIYTPAFDRSLNAEVATNVYKDKALTNCYKNTDGWDLEMHYESIDGINYYLQAFDILSPELPNEKFTFKEHIIEPIEGGIYIKTQSKGLVKIISL